MGEAGGFHPAFFLTAWPVCFQTGSDPSGWEIDPRKNFIIDIDILGSTPSGTHPRDQ
jgi:hypothetical protein